MSAGYDSTSPRFFRPADVARIRRNQRRIQFQRMASIGGKAAVIIGLVAGSFLIYRQTQGDARFAVKTIEINGSTHTSRAAIDAITRQYIGANLFRIDIARLQADLRRLGWVKRIEAEKKLPDTLRIRIVERTPVALRRQWGPLCRREWRAVRGSRRRWVTALPLVTNAPAQASAQRCSSQRPARATRRSTPDLRGKPVAPNGFALFDHANRRRLHGRRGSLREMAGPLRRRARGAPRHPRHRICRSPVCRPHRRQTGSRGGLAAVDTPASDSNADYELISQETANAEDRGKIHRRARHRDFQSVRAVEVTDRGRSRSSVVAPR
jgi:hypothetical protein